MGINYNLVAILVAIVVIIGALIRYGQGPATKEILLGFIEHVFGNYTVLAIIMVGAIGIVAMHRYSDEGSSEKVVLSCISGILGAATGYALKTLQNSGAQHPQGSPPKSGGEPGPAKSPPAA